MNILFISEYYWPHVGRVERHVHEISLNLKKKGHKVTIISEEDIKYPHIKYFGLLYIWYWFFKNRDLIKQSDTVHCHDVFIWYLPFRFLYPKKAVYTTFHGYEEYPLRKISILLRKLSSKLSRGNICIGRFIEKWYGIKADYISYGAVDTSKFRPRDIEPEYDAVFVGRNDKQTGINQYLKIKKKILVVCNKPDPENYYALGKFAFVSRYLSILEAFACKKPVIALYDNPLKKDYLNITPFKKWIETASGPDKLSYKISESRIDSAYKWVQTQTWERLTEIYLKLWEE